MTPTDLARKALAVLATASLSACGAVESDPHRFERLAQHVADIRLSPERSQDAPSHDARAGLRPALRVEVLELDAFWQARDGEAMRNGMRGMIDAAAPVVAEAVAQQASRAVIEGLRPALASEPVTAPVSARTLTVTIQLGAYSSEAAAREAWTRFGQGPAGQWLTGLSPVLEPVAVNGRQLVRLKASVASAEAAARICNAAEISDPWCRAAGRA